MVKNLRVSVAAAMALGALVRAAYFFQHRSSPFFEPVLLDPAFYHALALRFLEGRWIQETAFFGPPLYPLFLAAVYKLAGTGATAPKIVQLSLGVLHIGLVALLAQRLFRRPVVSAAAAFIAAVYGPYVFHEEMIVPEAVGIPLYTGSLFLALSFWKKPGPAKALGLGLLFGLAGLVKAGIFIFALVFLAGFALLNASPFKNRLVPALFLAAGCVGAVAPVTWHNWAAARDFVPLTWHGGLNFYIGNHEGADGIYKTPPGIRTNIDGQILDSKALAERESGRPLRPSEISRFWSDKAWAFIRQNPAVAARLWLRKALFFLNRMEITDAENPLFAGRFASVLGFLPGFAPLLILALPGLVFGLRAADRSDAVWVILWIACYMTGVALFFANARYRLPLVSAIIPFAAFGAREGAEVFRRRLVLQGAVWALAAFAAFGLTRAVHARPQLAVQWSNAGNFHMSRGRLEEAVRMYQEALRQDPGYGKAHNDLGVVYQKMGRMKDAEAEYREAVRLEPENAYGYSNLGMMADSKGDLDAAERFFRKAIELQPAMAEAHNNMGMVLGKKKDYRGAEPYFKRAIELNPASRKARVNLGLIYAYAGRPDEARRTWEEALRTDPGNAEARRALNGFRAAP